MNAEAKAQQAELTARLNDTELEHYRLCVENYPTDLAAKYEYGLRLLQNQRFNEAIPLFQEAQKDPRHKIAAMDKIGSCFFLKGWYADAVDVFARAIDAYEIKEDGLAKELRYNLARAYEEQGQKEKALDVYRRIAQLDFGYKDVSARVDRLRAGSDKSGTRNAGKGVNQDQPLGEQFAINKTSIQENQVAHSISAKKRVRQNVTAQDAQPVAPEPGEDPGQAFRDGFERRQCGGGRGAVPGHRQEAGQSGHDEHDAQEDRRPQEVPPGQEAQRLEGQAGRPLRSRNRPRWCPNSAT